MCEGAGDVRRGGHDRIDGYLCHPTGHYHWGCERQAIFDQILPGILPLGLTFACFVLLKKGARTTSVMFGIIVVSIVGALVGVL